MLYLVFDRVNKTLVPWNGSAIKIPTLFQTNVVELQIQFVDPAPDCLVRFEVSDESARAPVVTLAQKTTGTEGDEATYLLAQAVESAFTWDITNQWFTGYLNLNTTALADYLGTAPKADAVFELNLTTGGVDPETMYQSPVCVAASAYVPGTTTTPVTTSGSLQLKDGVAGVTIDGNLVTVTGLNWPVVPKAVLVFVDITADGAGVIYASYIGGSATKNGFQFNLSGLPDNDSYTFTYIPVF